MVVGPPVKSMIFGKSEDPALHEEKEISGPEDIDEFKMSMPRMKSLAERFEEGYSVKLTEKQARSMEMFISRRRHGHVSAAPMLCAQEECPYSKKCPLAAEGVFPPLLSPCPIESELLLTWTLSRAENLDIDLNDKKQVIESAEVMTTALLDLYQHRADMEMADNPKIVQRHVIGVNDKGNPIYDEKVNPRLSAILMLESMKSKKWSDLVATRKERSKDKSRNKESHSDYVKELVERAKTLQAKVIQVDVAPEEQA